MSDLSWMELSPGKSVQTGARDTDNVAPQRGRAARGTAGTFAGRRPPKCPGKLRQFLADKAVHDAMKRPASAATLNPRKAVATTKRQARANSTPGWRAFVSTKWNSLEVAHLPFAERTKALAKEWKEIQSMNRLTSTAAKDGIKK